MRKIFTDANAFGLSNGDIITITLLNKVGQELTTTYKNQLISYKKSIEIINNKLEVELYENDILPNDSYYEIVIKDIKFKFKICSNNQNTPHELTSLLQLGSNDEVAYISNGNLVFENDFIEKIELKFTNKEPYFTENQERVFNFLIFYADYVHDKETTIDIEKLLDQQLGNI